MGVHDHVEERAVQHHLLRQAGVIGVGVRLHRRGRGGPRAALVHLDEGAVPHGADIEAVVGGAAHTAQVGGGQVEQVGDAHGLQGRCQLQLRAAGELGQGRLHLAVMVLADEVIELGAVKRGQELRQGRALVRQQRREGVAPAGVGLQKARRAVAGEVDALLAPHKLRVLPRAVGGVERVLPHGVLVVIVLPFGIEGGGVDQVQHGHVAGCALRQDGVDHAGGVLLHPGVHIGGQGGIKGGAVDLRAVVADAGAEEIVLHPERVPQPQGVGQGEAGLFTVVGQAHAEGVEVVVQFGQAHAHGVFHLLQRLAGRAVGRHAQGIQDGQRGEQAAGAARVGVLQQGQGKGRDRRAAVGQVGGSVEGLRADVAGQLLGVDAAGHQRQRRQQRQQQRCDTFFHGAVLLSQGTFTYIDAVQAGKVSSRRGFLIQMIPQRRRFLKWEASPGGRREFFSRRVHRQDAGAFI